MSDPLPDQVEDAAREISEHPALEALARGGYVVNGVLHLVIAWIAARITIGWGGEADQAGALGTVREAPLGSVMLWVGVVGYTGLAIWQLLEAAVAYHPGPDPSSWASRAKDAAKAVVYGVLAWTASVFAVGGSTDSGQTSSDVTAMLMGVPLGQAVVFAVGLAVLGVAGYHVVKGVRRLFLRDLAGNADGELGRVVVWAGTAGYVAKGIALALVGVLFAYAAWSTDAQEATGLDAALKVLSDSTAGSALLAVIAVGLAAYGLYSFARARYARL